MSAALAAARKRRAPASAAPEITPPPAAQSSQNAVGLTLPQVIALVDSRLITLEKFMKSQQDGSNHSENISMAPSNNELAEIVNEFNSRYSILAEEIDNIKNIVLNLQSYTMNVNKTLLEERVHVLSEIIPPPVGLDSVEPLREFELTDTSGI